MRPRFLLGVILLVLIAWTSACVPAVAQRPPRTEGWATDWSTRAVPMEELQSGGVPRDGIPALDAPRFVTVEAARTWIDGQEPVVALLVEGVARAYPLQILTWHEIVNDDIAGVPVAVTFCPLCYSALAFDRRAAGRTLTFGVSGLLRHSDLVMYDRQTESLWQQLTGTAIVGTLTGTELRQLPAQIVAFDQFAAAYPDGAVLSRATGFDRPYGRNPYAGYDDVSRRPFLYDGPYDERLPPMEKVVAVEVAGQAVAYPHRTTRTLRVVHDTLGTQPLVVFHAPGAVSALDEETIARSRTLGSTGVFDPRVDGQALRFRYEEGHFVDDKTGSRWAITGEATDGPLAGRQLTRIPHIDVFSFAWFAFQPETVLYRP